MAVHELATMLSVPTATAFSALHNGRRGVLSLSLLAPGGRLIHENELLPAPIRSTTPRLYARPATRSGGNQRRIVTGARASTARQ